MKVIATTGMPGCGKGEVLKYLKERGIPALIMREIVTDEMEKVGLELTNKNIREFATDLRKKNGQDIVAKMCLKSLREMEKEHDVILVDGIRGFDEVKLFKKELTEDFILIAIFASPKTRFNRLKNRGEKWDMQNWEEFEWRDGVELSWGLGNAIALSDYTINNSDSLENFHKQLEQILEKITD
jgi:dephospho-CoA kinase